MAVVMIQPMIGARFAPPIEYRLVLDQFHIDRTRSTFDDTNVLSFQGRRDGQDLPQLSLSTGDVDEGDHLINLQFDPIGVPTNEVEVRFGIMNSGHANEAAFRKDVDDAVKAAAAAAAAFSGPASAWITIAGVLFDLVSGVNCDGPVAGDVMHASAADLAQLTINWPHIFRWTRGYPGTDSGGGCGRNSIYSVSWYVQLLDPFEPRLDLLVHLEDYGDRTWHENQFAGTAHEGKRIEGFQLQIDPPVQGLTLRYMAHLEDTGDTGWVGEGEFVGTRGEDRRLEGFAVMLDGPLASNYYVQYDAQVEGRGVTGPTLNGAFCGTRGQSLRLEGMTVVIHRMPTTGPS